MIKKIEQEDRIKKLEVALSGYANRNSDIGYGE